MAKKAIRISLGSALLTAGVLLVTPIEAQSPPTFSPSLDDIARDRALKADPLYRQFLETLRWARPLKSYEKTAPLPGTGYSDVFSDGRTMLQGTPSSFEEAQQERGASKAQGALFQAAIRRAESTPEVSTLLQEQKQLRAEMAKLDYTVAREFGDIKILAPANDATERRQAVLLSRIDEIDAKLTRAGFQIVTDSQAASISDVQKWLAANEALVFFNYWQTAVWVITKETVRKEVLEYKVRSFLWQDVGALRCGLDASQWTDPRSWAADTPAAKRAKNIQYARRFRCMELTGLDCASEAIPPFGKGLLQQDKTADHPCTRSLLHEPRYSFGQPQPDTLPFDLGRAHALYKGLFGKVEDLIKDKHLLIVPTGVLAGLPFQVLVTEAPHEAFATTFETYKKTAWLGARNALTVLPAVATLRLFRDHPTPSRATEPYMGFGNPLLTGPSGSDRRAWIKEGCEKAQRAKRDATKAVSDGQVSKPSVQDLADIDELRRLQPLPETADELCSVARALGARNLDQFVHIGRDATEATVKQLSADGSLARARVVHFATHGLMGLETMLFAERLTDPALVLTPPSMATVEDDGLLTASEVAALRLDADLVILSACNTAADDGNGTEVFSGLASAFFSAGTRALIVSHWPVNSDATVSLITGVFDAQKADPGIGRAEAMRRAVREMIDHGRPHEAHPAYWAPFAVVGEGGQRH